MAAFITPFGVIVFVNVTHKQLQKMVTAKRRKLSAHLHNTEEGSEAFQSKVLPRLFPDEYERSFYEPEEYGYKVVRALPDQADAIIEEHLGDGGGPIKGIPGPQLDRALQVRTYAQDVVQELTKFSDEEDHSDPIRLPVDVILTDKTQYSPRKASFLKREVKARRVREKHLRSSRKRRSLAR